MPPTVRVNLVADAAGFSTGMKSAIDRLKSFEQQAQGVQARINGMFKSGSTTDFARQLESQFKAKIKLQDQLFNATHSDKDIALRELKIQMDGMRSQWRNHEQMLTLITKTETAKRLEIQRLYHRSYANTGGTHILESAANAMQNNMTMGKGFSLSKLVGRGTAIGGSAWLAGESLSAVAKAIEAKKAGENIAGIGAALAGNLPVLSWLVKGVKDVTDSLSGAKQRAEEFAKALEFSRDARNDFRSLSDRLRELQGVSPEQIRYEQTINELLEKRKALIDDLLKSGTLFTGKGQTALNMNAMAIQMAQQVRNAEVQKQQAEEYSKQFDSPAWKLVGEHSQREFDAKYAFDPLGAARMRARIARMPDKDIDAYVDRERKIRDQEKLNEKIKEEDRLTKQILNSIKSKADIFKDYRKDIEGLVNARKLTKEQGEKALKLRMNDLMGGNETNNMRGESQAVNTKFVSFGGLLANSPNTMLKKLDDQIEELRKISTKLVDVKVAVENSGGGI